MPWLSGGCVKVSLVTCGLGGSGDRLKARALQGRSSCTQPRWRAGLCTCSGLQFQALSPCVSKAVLLKGLPWFWASVQLLTQSSEELLTGLQVPL